MKNSPLLRAIKHFLLTTTLHGFKYLCSPFYIDRVGWLAWCCASACCGGVLCGVVWARFLHTPALLVSRDTTASEPRHPLPLVAVCVSANRVVHAMTKHLKLNPKTTQWLPQALNRIFLSSRGVQDQFKLMDDLLTSHNLTLPQMLVRYTPPCNKVVSKCRWQNVMMDCDDLFVKEMTQAGVCCVMHPDELNKPSNNRMERLEINQRLMLALQCNSGFSIFGCEFFTRFHGEDVSSPAALEAGSYYKMSLQFTSVQDKVSERLVQQGCESSDKYSKKHCLIKCTEKICGCSDPLRRIEIYEHNVPPPCLVSQMNCLNIVDNTECNCPPTCKKISTDIVVETSPLRKLESCVDPIFSDLNATSSILIDLLVIINRSKIYDRIATETWLTLLSSLGGVFNMFLGVGVFSALEFLFFILVRLPIAIRKSTEMTPVTELYNNEHRISSTVPRPLKHSLK